MPHDLVALSRRWFEVGWNQRRIEIADELAGETFVIHGLSENGQTMQTVDDFRRFHAMFTSAFPDLRVTVEDVLVDGDKTAVRLTFTGTHNGPGLGIGPTGRSFRSTAIIIMHWRDGRIVESWNEFDADGMMRQLAGPAPVHLKA